MVIWRSTDSNHSITLTILLMMCRLDSTMFYIAGIPVCLEAWRKIFGTGRTKLYEIYQMFRDNFKILSPKKRQKRIKSKLQTNIATGWMAVYFKRIDEKMLSTISVNPPCYLTRENIRGDEE